jgi:CRISPR system Cascade subunit CasA
MGEFNLIDKGWIPCIDLDGEQVELGIRDALFRANELREVCDDSPLVTVAIHRLLLAILSRAFEGPADMRAWRALYQAGSLAGKKCVADYLGKWHARFFLCDDTHPFCQMASLETKKAVSVSRLATERASGNNATLFDHSADDTEVTWSRGQAARQLVACQSFALGFGKSGNAKICGKEEDLPYSADAIALRGMNVWLQGEDLFQTLLLNLAPNEDPDLAAWELKDSNQDRDRLRGKKRQTVSSRGPIDRFTWQSRLIKLLPSDGRVSSMFFTQGRSADKSPGDPMKVYRAFAEEGVSARGLSSAKAAWRDAHSILMIPPAGSNERRPECFNLVARALTTIALQPGTPMVTHIVGLASAPKKAGKFLLWRHDRMPVPPTLLGSDDMIERLGQLLGVAERVGSELGSRCWRIARFFRVPGEREPNEKEKEDIEKLKQDIDPRPAYWSRLEQHFFDLLANLPGDWDEAQGHWKLDDEWSATRAWREAIKREAKQALEESIRSLGTTARAIQAVARVRIDFSDADLQPAAKKQARAAGRKKGGKKK